MHLPLLSSSCRNDYKLTVTEEIKYKDRMIPGEVAGMPPLHSNEGWEQH